MTAAAMVGFGALFAARLGVESLSATEKAAFNPTAYSLSGFFFAQLAVGVFGVLAMTGEYSTGSIRTTLIATPQRRSILGAKAIVAGAATMVVGTVSSFLAFFVGQAILTSKGLEAHLGDPGAARSVIGAALYLTVLVLISLGLGTLLRSAAGAIATVVALVFVLPGLANALPTAWQNAIVPYFSSYAGEAIIGPTRFAPSGPHLLAPGPGFAVACAYAAVALTGAALTLSRRDTR